jgi:hypothetical protein
VQPPPQHRSMGGILGKERGERFERDAHVNTHMMSGANGRGSGGVAPAATGPAQQGRPGYAGAGRYGDEDEDEDEDEETEGSITPTGPAPKKKWMIWKWEAEGWVG